MPEQRVRVGKILKEHGVKGEVAVLPLTDFPQRFRRGTRYEVGGSEAGEGTWLTLRGVRANGKLLLLSFAGVDTPEAAARLRGAYLQVRPDEVEPLPEGSFYPFQLLGLKALTEDGRELGAIDDVLVTGANDVWQVRRPDGQSILLPATREVILRVDLEQRRILVRLLPGLLEPEEV